MSTQFTCDDTETLVAYLYDDIDPAMHDGLARHLLECARCRGEVAALGGVRRALAQWTPPVPSLRFSVGEVTAADHVIRPAVPAWRTVPVWAQVAAATLALAVGAAIANVQVRHDAEGWTVSTGWMAPAVPAAAPAAQRPADNDAWRLALAQLEQSLRREMSGRMAAATVAATPTAAPAATAALDTETLARVRTLIDASEKRQQQELALRLTQLGRDMDLQRRADLVRVEQGLGQLESRAGAEVARQRQVLDMVVRAGLRPPQ